MQYNDIKTPQELYQFMKENIIYGFVSDYNYLPYTRDCLNDNNLYDRLILESYFLQTPQEVLNTKHAICFDQVEFARTWFLNNGYRVYTFFVKGHNHCILIYEDNNKFYFFERTLKKIIGIHEFSTLEEAIYFYKLKESIFCNIDINDIEIYEYDTVVFGCGFLDFCYHITEEVGVKLNLKK